MTSNQVILAVTLAALAVGLVWMGIAKLLEKPLSPAQRWALAASGNLGGNWNDRFARLRLPFPRQEIRQNLIQWWNIHSPAEAAESLAWLANQGHSEPFRPVYRKLSRLRAGELEPWLAEQLEEERPRLRWLYANLGLFKDGDLVSWDMERLINLARMIYSVGWIDEATAWRHIAVAARRLQAAYGSWHEMSDNFLAGRIWWGSDSESNPYYRQTANRLLTDLKSPWVKLDWHTPLM